MMTKRRHTQHRVTYAQVPFIGFIALRWLYSLGFFSLDTKPTITFYSCFASDL